MAEIVNPQVAKFTNERVRPTADRLYGLYYELKSAHYEYFNQGIGGLINTGGAGNLITDGSQTDGRARIAGGQVYTWVAILEAVIAALEASGNLDALSGIQVNGLRG